MLMWTCAGGGLVGGGVMSVVTRRFLRADGEDVAVCAADGGSNVALEWLPLEFAESRLLLASSLRQLRKMLYTAAEEGEGTCCLMSTRSRNAGSWRETVVSTNLAGRLSGTRRFPTMASTRLLVQQTKMLGRLRRWSRAVRSWFVAWIECEYQSQKRYSHSGGRPAALTRRPSLHSPLLEEC
jgi:hypothetical protein